MHKPKLGQNIASFPHRNDALPFFPCLITMACIAIGTGPSKLGYNYRCGIILGPLLSIFVGVLSCFNMYLFVKVGCYHHVSTFEEMWTNSFSRGTSWIPLLISVASTILIDMFYSSTLVSCIQSIISFFAPNFTNFLTNYWILSLISSLLLVSPFIFSQSLFVLSRAMMFKFVVIILISIFMIIEFILIVKEDGFDPNHQLKLMHFDSGFMSIIGSVLTMYLIAPLSWPSLQHLYQATEKRLFRLFLYQTLICFVVYNLMGIVSYLTFFELNQGGIVFNYYRHRWIQITSYILLSIMLVFTLPTTINPARFNLMTYSFKMKDVPKPIWYMTGFCIQLGGVILSSSTTNFGFVLSLFGDALSPTLLAILPALLYIKTFGSKSKFLFYCCILDLIIGVVGVVLEITLYFVDI